MTRPYDKSQRQHASPVSDYSEWLDEGTAVAESDAVAHSDYDVTVQHLPDQRRYAAWINPIQVGHLDYKFVGKRIALLSTEVTPEYRHHGVATELIGATLEDIRTTGKKITVICPVVRAFINHYPQYEDMIDLEHPGVRSDDPRVRTDDVK
jgi:predicted GNAT family acetyltransferase